MNVVNGMRNILIRTCYTLLRRLQAHYDGGVAVPLLGGGRLWTLAVYTTVEKSTFRDSDFEGLHAGVDRLEETLIQRYEEERREHLRVVR